MAAKVNLDISKGRNPRDIPVYSVAEAARYLRLPVATVRAWTAGRTRMADSGARRYPPVIETADRAGNLLSFLNLVELHVLSSLRRLHHVQMPAVRKTVRYLKARFGSNHPLIEPEMLTDGKSLFVAQYGQVVNASADGQIAMCHVLEAYLKRVERDNHGVPIRLYPFTRSVREVESIPRLISIDPGVRFGEPCIAGTRIPTRIIAERHEAGDSVALLAEDYGRPPEEIEEALRYESRAAS